MKLIFKLSLLTILICVYTLHPSYTYSQVPSSIDGININIGTDNPRPGQTVDVSVESFSIDLNSSSIIWLVNGKTQNQGIGVKKISVTAPKTGVKMNILAIIKTPEGVETRKSTVIKTGSVEIVWETEGYTPPFFKGKAPFVYQNKLRLIAVPHLSKDGVKELDPKTLVYSWKRDGKYIENGQGYGKQYVEIAGDDLPKIVDVTVEVYNREQTDSSMGSITLDPTEPMLSFYEEDSLYGILFNRSLMDKASLKNKEMKVVAIPYGFSMGNNSNSYMWSINDIEQTDLNKNRSITIRTKGDASGSSNISLDMRNIDSILQGARGEFTVYFSKKSDEEEVDKATF